MSLPQDFDRSATNTAEKTAVIVAPENAAPLAMNGQDSVELSSTLLGVIARAASDPQVDVAKMERLLEMQLKVMDRAAEVSFNKALARLKAQLPRITKNGAILLKSDQRIQYAKYEDIHDAVMPLMTEHGFTVTYSAELASNGTLLRVTATFRHADGHHDSGSVFLPLTDESGAKNKVQGAGSILSYGKRYALCQYLDIVTEGADDDGAQGDAQPISERQQSEIIDLIADSGANEAKFLEFMHVSAVEEILVKDFQKAKNALQQKRRGRKS
jgi:hypothetical protein